MRSVEMGSGVARKDEMAEHGLRERPHNITDVARAAGVVFRRMKPATIRRLIAGYESHVAICCWALIDQRRLHEFG